MGVMQSTELDLDFSYACIDGVSDHEDSYVAHIHSSTIDYLSILSIDRRPYQQSSLMRHVHVEGMSFLLKMSSISFNAPQESSSTSTFSVGSCLKSHILNTHFHSSA